MDSNHTLARAQFCLRIVYDRINTEMVIPGQLLLEDNRRIEFLSEFCQHGNASAPNRQYE